MLKSNVGYSTNPDSFTAGIETAELTSKDLKNINSHLRGCCKIEFTYLNVALV